MNISINGFGRIGRNFLRAALERDLNIVAINDLSDPKTLAHLFKYDTVHRGFKGSVSHDDESIIINGKRILILAEKNPEALPWKSMNIDLVIESTGKFTDLAGASKHLQAGAKQVIISAPATDKEIPMVVLGVNDHLVDLQSPVLSNASCTTNNVAPMMKILDDKWGIVEGYITTIHSMTGDQSLHDAPHKDLRRARAASASIIPTTTGAAKAVTHIFPHLDGNLGGAGVRVPVLNGSLTDLTCILKSPASIEAINKAFQDAAANEMINILEYTEDPIVSVDILDNTHSCVFDAQLTSIVGDLVKVVGWYDNESGYSARLVDLVLKISSHNQVD
ncbi:type I glyceraldehyde-3-phosphate dehydrogenase [Pedobacter quisquiliarum]|uniref:Type I glyceraldehyde-3-phosphate dehydrogenase n=1 Tax=Pedobacter quisquiliarum TaxID=1834438 RepID=A0A916UEL4_9SPHI|nr:type I glyceraldehyde-3-phosphate dehydrogenase [Pedobacter quisquiliarum]GGC69863.1 type I glyceraldehyde-3-phosphate dehydrogenase [Pedobacter quisquiliarum]